MDQDDSFRIEAEAARALAEWKALFAEEVATKAKELAKKSDAPGVVTLDHYRAAASLAVQVLAGQNAGGSRTHLDRVQPVASPSGSSVTVVCSL